MNLPVGGQTQEVVKPIEAPVASMKAPTLFELERDYILQTLVLFRKNKYKAAQALGITVKTLYNKLHKYGEFDNFKVKRNQ